MNQVFECRGTVDQHTDCFYSLGRLTVLSQDPKNNTTKFLLQLLHGTTITAWTWDGAVMNNWISLNGAMHYLPNTARDNNPWTDNPCQLYSKEFTVAHDAEGKCTLDIQMYSFAPSGVYGPGNVYIPSSTGKWRVTLPDIDRSAPVVETFAAVLTPNIVEIEYTTDVDCDAVEYRINNGEWITVPTENYFTLSNLNSNTGYIVTVRARRTENHVWGEHTVAFQTHPNPVVVQTLVATATSPFEITVTVTTNDVPNTLKTEVFCGSEYQYIDGGSGTFIFPAQPDQVYDIAVTVYTVRSLIGRTSITSVTTPPDNFCRIIETNGAISAKKRMFLIDTTGVVTEVKKEKVSIL